MTEPPVPSAPPPDRVLACGRRSSELVGAVVETDVPLDDHQQSCPECQRELAALQAGWGAMESVASASAGLSPERVEHVVESVRSRIHRPGTFRAVQTTGGGALSISESVLVDLARRAAESVEGVGAVAGRFLDDEIDLDVVVPYGHDLTAVADAVRRRVHQTVQALAGVTLAGVGVEIVDITAG